MENANETVISARVAAISEHRYDTDLARRNGRKVCTIAGGNISVTMYGAEGSRVNNTDEQGTRQRTREGRAFTVRAGLSEKLHLNLQLTKMLRMRKIQGPAAECDY